MRNPVLAIAGLSGLVGECLPVVSAFAFSSHLTDVALRVPSSSGLSSLKQMLKEEEPSELSLIQLGTAGVYFLVFQTCFHQRS